jgi:hypothetical protein
MSQSRPTLRSLVIRGLAGIGLAAIGLAMPACRPGED